MRGVKAVILAAAALALPALAEPTPAAATTLCSEVPEVGTPLKCPTGKEYSGAIEGGLTGKAIFTRTAGGLSPGAVECTESVATSSFHHSGGPLDGIEFVSFLTGGEPKCPSTFLSKPEIEVSLLNVPYNESSISYLGAAEPQGRLEVAKNVRMKLRVLGMVEFSCVYEPTTPLTANINNGNKTEDSELKFVGAPFKLDTGGMSCPTAGKFDAIYKVVRPGGRVYVAG